MCYDKLIILNLLHETFKSTKRDVKITDPMTNETK